MRPTGPPGADGETLCCLPCCTTRARGLGHEDTATTHQYIEADLAMKEAALKRMDAPSSKPVRFKANDRLLAFLEAL
jgi:integrase/recombinase XerD